MRPVTSPAGRLRRRPHAGHGPGPGRGRLLLQRGLPQPGGRGGLVPDDARRPGAAPHTERRLQDFLAEHITPLQQRGYSNAALDKTLAHIGGWAGVGTRVRWPYRSVPEAEATALRPVARAAVPELIPDT